MTFQFAITNDVDHEVRDGVLTVTVNRQEKRNPLSLGVLERIREIFSDLTDDDRIVCAVLTGAGDKAFASGGDLTELMAYRDRDAGEDLSRHGKAALQAIRAFPVPVVGRINGLALGGGAELSLACDQRWAAQTARFGFIHGRLGIAPSWGGGADLVRLVGPARALRMMASAEIFEVEAALAEGVFDRVCPAGQDYDAWFALELEIFRKNPRQVNRAFKAISRCGHLLARSAADDIETHNFGEVWAHQDHWDAVARLERK